jgi:hypothetical protein
MDFPTKRTLKMRKGSKVYTFLCTDVPNSVRIKLPGGSVERWTSIERGRAVFKTLINNGYKPSELCV